MTKTTKREMYEALISLATNGTLTYEIEDGTVEVTAEALAAFAENEIALLDKKATKAKERAAEKRAQGDELTDAVRAVLTDEFQIIADIAAQVEGEDVSAAKVSYRLTQLAKNGEAERTEMTIPGTDGGKARKVVAFRKIAG